MSDALRQQKPKVVVLFNENPDWPESDKAWTQRMVDKVTEALEEKGYTHQTLKIFDSLSGLADYDPKEWLVWNWAEEIGGQAWTDSVVAAELGERGFAYTGSPPETLLFSCDRLRVKKRLQEFGVPTLPARLYAEASEAADWAVFPAIVKGANQHGSFGIEGNSIVHNPEQLAARIQYMRDTYQDDSLVEQFLDSREFHVGVFGNGNADPLPPAEYDYSAFSDMHDRLFTYSWKYDDKSWGYHAVKIVAPAPQDKPLWRESLQAVAVAAYKALGVTDYGRIDLRMLGDEPQVLDVNPNPDLDSTSALMASARSVGMTYADVVERIVKNATARMPNGRQ
jgi:D-alanine-D-alanine ligase